MTFMGVLNAICEDFEANAPNVKVCEPHGGRFDLEELSRIAARTPAVFVAIQGSGKGEAVGNGETDTPLSLSAFVVVGDASGLPKAKAALDMVEWLLNRIHGRRWGVEGAQPAGIPVCRNLYSGKIAERGVALWAVSWVQMVRIGVDRFGTDLPHPTKLKVGMAPEIGKAHESDYEAVTP